MNFICFNGDFVPEDQPLFTAGNRGFKYGDGVFETIKVCKGNIPLATLHFERLFLSLNLLNIKPSFSEEQLCQYIIELCKKNNCLDLARVRLAVYREGEGNSAFVIEAITLSNEINRLNKNGLVIDLYPYARKSKDAFANLKSANFLPYVLAGFYAKENELDDCLVLNSDSQIADASKANIFLVKNKKIVTPALHQGCVNGVMRRFLIDGLKKTNVIVHQQEIMEVDLLDADEVFLTNAIYGMRWVQSFKQREYANTLTASVYQRLISALWE